MNHAKRIGTAAGMTALLGLASFAWAGPDGTSPSRVELRTGMGELFGALVDVLAYESTLERPGAPPKAALETLKKNAGLAGRHFQAGGSDARLYASHLASATQRLERAIADRSWVDLEISVHRVVDACMFCHTRNPKLKRTPVSQIATAQPSIISLPADRRAHVFAGLHLYEAAASTWHGVLARRTLNVQRDQDDLLDFMVVQLRAPSGYLQLDKRLRAFEKVTKDAESKKTLRQWRTALRVEDALKRPITPMLALERCRSYIEASDRVEPLTLVHQLLALEHCQRVLDTSQARLEKAEALYLLGEAERGLRPHRVSDRIEALYVEAILLAPKSPIATQSYASLRSWLDFQETGSEGRPPKDHPLLKDLAPLVRAP